MRVNFERNWCEYFMECPHGNKDSTGEPILVGSYECKVDCPCFNMEGIEGRQRYIECNKEDSK